MVNTFDDGEEKCAHDWLRNNERDMASLAWEMAATREREGLGTTKVLHQLGHPEKRKAAADFDVHEQYNFKVDALTHKLTPDMPLYISFRRCRRAQTELWYEPTKEENIGHGACYEVSGDVYRHITKAAQRRTSIARLARHCGEFHATFERGVTGRVPSEPPGPLMANILNNHLPTEARVNSWGGMAAGALTCGCGHVLAWHDRSDIGPLQWHGLQCMLPEVINIRRRWKAAIKRTIVAATRDLAVAERVMACWAHCTDGTIHTADDDQVNNSTTGGRRRWRSAT